MQIAIYDSATGAVIRTMTCPDPATADLQVKDGQAWLEGPADDVADYVNLDGPEPAIAPRGDYTLEALPLPCTVTIEGVAYACTEQPAFAFEYPGTYTIAVDAGPAFLKKEFEYDYYPA